MQPFRFASRSMGRAAPRTHILAKRQMSTVLPPAPPTDEEIKDAVKGRYEKAQLSLPKRLQANINEYVLNHQPQFRLGVLAAGSAGIWSMVDNLCMYAATACDGMGFDPATTGSVLYLGGAVSALTALGLIKMSANILSLAGQPSEPVIQEIFRRVLSNEGITAKVGDDAKVGNFCTVATQEGSFRFLNTKKRIYADWLKFDANKFTSPLAPLPCPNFLQKTLSSFPGFQTVAWNNGANARAALNILQESGSPVANMAPIANNPRQETGKDREKSLRNESDYSGWERYWRPRRLQVACHIKGSKDEGLLLAEVEKNMVGEGRKHSGGFTKFKTVCFVSLKSGEVTMVDGPEVPTILGHPQLSLLFDTIPVEKRQIPMDTAAYVRIEDEYKEEVKAQKAKQSDKVADKL